MRRFVLLIPEDQRRGDAEHRRGFSVLKSWECPLPRRSPNSDCSAPQRAPACPGAGSQQPTPGAVDLYEMSPWDFKMTNSSCCHLQPLLGIHSVPKHGSRLKTGEKWRGEICACCATDPGAQVTLENICARSSPPQTLRTQPTSIGQSLVFLCLTRRRVRSGPCRVLKAFTDTSAATGRRDRLAA